MADTKAYKELQIPKGGARAFSEALAKLNDLNTPPKKKAPAKKKPAPKKGK